MHIGYARISTDDQKIDLQIDALKNYGCKKIYKEVATGARTQRPELSALLKSLRPGDKIIIWRLDRLSRSLRDLIRIANELQSINVELISLTESIDTTTPTGRMLFHFFGLLAEFERDLLKERTSAGRASARARGFSGGRPFLLNKRKQKMLFKLYDDKKKSINDICDLVGISRGTLYNYIRDEKVRKKKNGK